MKTTARERLRYRIDTLLARGSSGALLWLGGATVLLTVVGAIVFWILGIDWGGRSGPAEALWRSFVIAIGKGVIADATWTQRLATLIFIFASLFLAGSLVGLLVSAINRRLDDLRRGHSRVLERNHTLVLGASERLMPVLDELLANQQTKNAIVVLAEQDKTALEDDLFARHPKPARRVVFRNGSPSRRADLHNVGIEHAKSVVVLNSGSAVDAITVRHALAANSFSPESVHVVAEMSNQRIARSLRRSTGGSVATVGIDATVADMLTQAIRSPGLVALFDDLLSFARSEFYIVDAAPIAGRTWLDATANIVDATALGLVTHDGVQLVPSNGRIVQEDERLVVLATSPTVRFDQTQNHQAQPDCPLTGEGVIASTIMVLGWSRVGESMLVDLDEFLAPGASIVVLADESMLGSSFPDPSRFSHQVDFRHTKHDPDEVRSVIDSVMPDVLVVLGYLSTLNEDEADALTLLTLHTLGNEENQSAHRPRIVAQMLNNEVGALARTTRTDDYVVTDAVVSRMLVHTARERALAEVFDDLFDSAGPSIRPLQGPTGSYTYRDLKMAAAERHLVLLGLSTPDGIETNLPGETIVDLTDRHRLLTLGRFDLMSR